MGPCMSSPAAVTKNNLYSYNREETPVRRETVDLRAPSSASESESNRLSLSRVRNQPNAQPKSVAELQILNSASVTANFTNRELYFASHLDESLPSAVKHEYMEGMIGQLVGSVYDQMMQNPAKIASLMTPRSRQKLNTANDPSISQKKRTAALMSIEFSLSESRIPSKDAHFFQLIQAE